MHTTPILLATAESAAKSGRINEARTLYQQVLAIDPTHAAALERLAWIEDDSGNFIEAISVLRKLIAVRPTSGRAHVHLGLCLKKTGATDEALAMLLRATEVERGYAPAFCNLGLLLESTGDTTAAVVALRQAYHLAPQSEFIAYHLAALSADLPPPTCPPDYLVPLFDGYADQFDAHLVQKLGYQGPKLLADIVVDRGRPRPWDVMDLGCGTGMSAIPFYACARSITGVDLSPRMLQQSARRVKPNGQRAYDVLLQVDIVTALLQRPAAFDLILAADVFIYIGDLTAVFKAVRCALRAGGLFAFTVESFEGPRDYQLRSTRRYAQSHKYVQRLAEELNLQVVERRQSPLREGEAGQMVMGDVYLLQTNPVL